MFLILTMAAEHQRAILTHLPKTTPFDINFKDIKFSVKQGGKKSKYINLPYLSAFY